MKIIKQLLLYNPIFGWLLRSASSDNNDYVGFIDGDGDVDYDYCYNSYGVVPVCIIT